jgi:hypothetical protein
MRAPFELDRDQHLADRAELAFRVHPLAHFAGARRRDFHRRLVGHDLDHRLVLVEGIPLLDQPADNLPLDHPFPDVRQLEFVDHAGRAP